MASLSARILIVDEDQPLLDLLARLLSEAGCSVETVCGAEGFTPELMALSNPSVVFLNPFMKGVKPQMTDWVVSHFREVSRAAVILIGAMPAEVLQNRTKKLEADGFVVTRDLLEDPVGEVPVTGLNLPPPPPADEVHVAPLRPQLDSLDSVHILDIDLEQVVPKVPTIAPVSVKSGPATAHLSPNLLKLIEDEVHSPSKKAVVQEFKVDLDVFTDNNLYGPDRASIAGVFIASALPPVVGAAARVSLTLPSGATVEAQGSVEWVTSQSGFGRRQRGGFGLKFTELGAAQLEQLKKFAALRAVRIVGPGGAP